jgi:uncharacterized protein GlcG (DUF336 family)
MSRITLDAANAIIEGALADGRSKNAKPLAVVVLDDSGHMVAAQREDDATMFRIDVALGKAWGAVAFTESSRDIAARAERNPNFLNTMSVLSGGRILPNPGALLIYDDDGNVLGAVGISGDAGAKDEDFAAAGIAAAGLRSTPD